jgi:hypothetical protein
MQGHEVRSIGVYILNFVLHPIWTISDGPRGSHGKFRCLRTSTHADKRLHSQRETSETGREENCTAELPLARVIHNVVAWSHWTITFSFRCSLNSFKYVCIHLKHSFKIFCIHCLCTHIILVETTSFPVKLAPPRTRVRLEESLCKFRKSFTPDIWFPVVVIPDKKKSSWAHFFSKTLPPVIPMKPLLCTLLLWLHLWFLWELRL